MPSASEISEQVARETRAPHAPGRPGVRRRRALPAERDHHRARRSTGRRPWACSRALRPAFSGEANPQLSPRAAEVKFISHHAFALIAGSTAVGDRDRRAHAGPAAAARRHALPPSQDLAGCTSPGSLRRHRPGVRERRTPGGQRDRDAQLRRQQRPLQPRRRPRADEGRRQRGRRVRGPARRPGARGRDDRDDDELPARRAAARAGWGSSASSRAC